MSTAQFVWLAATVVVALAWISRRPRRTRPISWRDAQGLRQKAVGQDNGKGFVGAVRWMLFADGLTMAFRWRLCRVQKLIGKLPGLVAKAEIALRVLRPALTEFDSSAKNLGDSTAPLSPEIVDRLSICLYLGDCAVATGILMADNKNLPLILALITSLAIATAQFAVGKVLGKAVAEHQNKKGPLFIGAALVVLVLLGFSLAALLHHLSWSWAFLSVTPAVGAAALTVAGHDQARQRHHRAKSQMKDPSKGFTKAMDVLGRGVGKASGAWAAAAALGVRTILAPEQAEAAAADVIVVATNLTDKVRGMQTMLTDVEVLKLGACFDAVVTRLVTLLAEVTTDHLDVSGLAQPQTAPSGPSGAPVAQPAGEGPAAATVQPPINTPAGATPNGATPNGGSQTVAP